MSAQLQADVADLRNQIAELRVRVEELESAATEPGEAKRRGRPPANREQFNANLA